MSQENLDLLRGHYDRWAAGNWTDGSIFDPHAVGVFPDPTPRAHYGREALADYMRRFLESWEDFRIEATDYREAGDSFVVRARLVATGIGSGIGLENELFHVWTFRGRLVVRMEVFDREADALEAAGLSE
jgi:ketosteroid isomerase-like protein